MSQFGATSSGGQSESPDRDSGPVGQNIPKTTTDSDTSGGGNEASLSPIQQPVDERGDYHETPPPDGNGELPLHLACAYGDQQLVGMLLDKRADPESMDAFGVYPLHSAVVRGFEATVICRLLGPGQFVINEAVGGAHWTPLNKAIYYGCEDVVDTLLEGGASLSIRDADGWTPLMTALKERLYDTFYKLLNHLQKESTKFSVIDIPDNDGMTPLMQLGAKDESRPIAAFNPLLKLLVDRLVEGESIQEPLCWAAYRLERHAFALSLFRKRFATEITQDPERDQWAIVEWAVYARMPQVLLTYLRTLGMEKRASEGDGIDKSISNGRKLIGELKNKLKQSSTPVAEGKKRKGERGRSWRTFWTISTQRRPKSPPSLWRY